MKFGIITLVSDNYGNKYQNYAVEQLLSDYGEVETFGLAELYQAPYKQDASKLSKLNPSYIREVLISRPMYQYDINGVYKGVVHNLLYAKKHAGELIKLREMRRTHFERFTDEHLHISDTVLNRENTGKVWADEYDYFVCGSDQIWNPNYLTTSELAFCSFAPEKTICLSPSFGVSQIPEHRKEEYSIWLKSLYRLSVRENKGQAIIKELTGCDATVLLDPTMAMPVEKWEELCKQPETKLPEHYIVCYFLGRVDKDYKKRVDSFAKKTGLPVVMLFDITTPKYYTYDPAEVLYTIKNADFVLTDSFHGTVFSILFHKNFHVFNRNEGGASMNSRIETLLDTFDLNNGLLDNYTGISDKVWLRVDEYLKSKRDETREYLRKNIQ